PGRCAALPYPGPRERAPGWTMVAALRALPSREEAEARQREDATRTAPAQVAEPRGVTPEPAGQRAGARPAVAEAAEPTPDVTQGPPVAPAGLRRAAAPEWPPWPAHHVHAAHPRDSSRRRPAGASPAGPRPASKTWHRRAMRERSSAWGPREAASRRRPVSLQVLRARWVRPVREPLRLPLRQLPASQRIPAPTP